MAGDAKPAHSECRKPLDYDDSPGGDGLIVCAMPEGHDGDCGRNTRSFSDGEIEAIRRG